MFWVGGGRGGGGSRIQVMVWRQRVDKLLPEPTITPINEPRPQCVKTDVDGILTHASSGDYSYGFEGSTQNVLTLKNHTLLNHL